MWTGKYLSQFRRIVVTSTSGSGSYNFFSRLHEDTTIPTDVDRGQSKVLTYKET